MTTEEKAELLSVVYKAVQAGIQPLVKRMDKLEERMDRLENRMASMETRMDKLDVRLRSLIARSKVIAADIDELRIDLPGLVATEVKKALSPD